MDLSYRNNPHSLFRKYQELVTWFANTPDGRELLRIPFNERIGLFLPNGYHKIIDEKYLGVEATFYTRPIYAPLLYAALTKVDLMQYYLRDFAEAQKVLQWALRLNKAEIAPRIVRQVLFDTATFNPNADTESTSVDGSATSTNSGTFASIRASNGSSAQDNSATGDVTRIHTAGDGVNWTIFTRSFFLFDTASINDAAVLNSGTFTFTNNSGSNTSYGGTVDLVQSSPASNVAIAASDFQGMVNNTTLQSDTQPAYTSLASGGIATDYPLNATGLGNVSKTGITKFGLRDSHDRANSEPALLGVVSASSADARYADNGANIPKLVVVYSGVSPSASQSPSASRSPSASSSPSISPSASLSPSASFSPSASVSASISPSASVSASVSPSASTSPSSSVSLSPSAGYSNYTRDGVAVLPVTNADLAIPYVDSDEVLVEKRNNTYVTQEGALVYMIHQFKNFVGGQTLVEIEWEGKSTLAPENSSVYLQVYNQHTGQWETKDVESEAEENQNFELEARISDVTNYKDGSQVMTCRVYQLAI